VSLFDFDPEQVAAIEAAHTAEQEAGGEARAARVRQRMQLRRAKGEKSLAEILPARFEAGDSWHVISHGDVDALSYLAHAIKATHFDYVALSTWCIARADIEQITAWLDAGLIDQFELYAGEIFPNQYGDEYELMQGLVRTYGSRMVVAKNHSKVTLACNLEENYYLAIESSANVNTNPRIEQTAIHASRELFEFYKEFFCGLKSIDRSAKGK
jgi:hypothetical protein